ncbi:MAG TPA: carboxypeptidase-like regulatory domain-containing protein [Ktedonobacteraceae bacterium]|nr:carboxypeptidase-like regulatory domain-containing protein [Ktedonobacteraceae bacterium]
MMWHNKYRVTIFLIACLITCLFPFASVSAAASNGRIYGQLLDGTNKQKVLLAGQSVTLQMAEDQSSRDLKTATTDAQGNFSFDNLATDKAISYAVYIRYQGAQYVSDLVSLASKSEQQVNLTVYQATQSTANIAITQATILVREPNIQSHMITFSEVFAFQNLDTHTYVGSLNASKGKPNALLFSLPPDARNITLNSGFDGYQELQVDRGFATDAALPPGNTQFAFTFSVPYSSSTYDFSYTTMYPTVSLSVLVPPDVHASASGALNAQGVITASDLHSYRLFKADKLLANQTLHTSLQGLITLQDTSARTSTPSSSTNSNANTILLIAVVLVMLAILAVTWFLFSSNRRTSTTKKGKRDEKRNGQASKGAKMQAKTTKEAPSDDRQQALLQELLELDKAYEAGTLKKGVYQERRNKTKARLRALMSEQETVRR